MVLALVAACGAQQEAADRSTTSHGSPMGTAAAPTRDPANTPAEVGNPGATASPASPTPTPTVEAAVPVTGWEDRGIRTLSVEIEFNYPERTPDLLEIVTAALDDIGVDLSDDGDASLSLDLEGSPRSAQYIGAGQCYSGARIFGTGRMTAEGMPELQASVDGDLPTRDVIRSCAEDPARAPFAEAFEIGFSHATARLFGPASMPYLTCVLATPRSGSHAVLLPIYAASIDAYRTLDYDDIPVTSQFEFLDSAIWSLAGVVGGGGDPADPPYIRTVRTLLLEYSETDFGFSDEDDLDAWRQWLEGWLAEAAGEEAIYDLRMGECFEDDPE